MADLDITAIASDTRLVVLTCRERVPQQTLREPVRRLARDMRAAGLAGVPILVLVQGFELATLGDADLARIGLRRVDG